MKKTLLNCCFTVFATSCIVPLAAGQEGPSSTQAGKDQTGVGKTGGARAKIRASSGTTVKQPPSPESVLVRAAGRQAAGGGLLEAHHEAKNVESVSRAYIDTQSPTQNVVNLLAQMPSVNVTPQDATGIVSSGLMIRGLTISDIGYVTDGAPSLAPGAGPYQAELLDNENVSELAIAPGSSGTADPVTSAVAGTIYTKMKMPLDQPGGLADFTYGSFHTFRGFLRLDTGELGNSGVRAFVSYSNANTDNWRGPGIQKKQHVDFKLVKDFSSGSSIAFEQVFNRDYSSYYYYPTAQQWAQEKWVNPDATYGGNTDTAFYRLNISGPFYEGLDLVPIHLVVNEHLVVDDVPYLWYGVGWNAGGATLQQGNTFQGSGPVNVNLAQNLPGETYRDGQDVLVNSGSYGITYEAGNNLKATWTRGPLSLFAGYWYENYNLNEKDPVGFVNQTTGVPADLTQSSDQYLLPNGQKYYSSNYFLHYQLNALYVGSNLSLLNDRLGISLGFKDVMVTRTVDDYIPGAQPHSGVSENVPLPSLGIRYNIDARNEVYLNAEGDYRQPFLGTTADTYSLTSGALQTGATAPKSEYALKEEIGYRFNGYGLLASVALYNMNLTNRLLTLNTYLNGVQIAETLNAGGQTSRGLDLQVATAPVWHHLSPYVTFAYLDAKENNNVEATNTQGQIDYLPTAGKTQIASPHYQTGLGLNYDDGTIFGTLNVRYVSSQYSSLMDDEQMPGYVTDTVSLGYRLPSVSYAKTPTIQVSLNNLNSSTQRTGVYGYTTNAQLQRGRFGGTIAGSSPTYYVEPGFAALLSISSRF